MASGQWTGTSLVLVDTEGHLLDGLHRCRAIVRTGVSIDVDITMTRYE